MSKTSLCDRVQDRASLYLDGRLAAATRRRIQDHLRGCDRCIGEYRALRRLSRLAGEMPATRPPRGLTRRVQRGLARRRQHTLARLSRAPWPARVSGIWLAAAVAIALLLPAAGMYVGYRLGRGDARAQPARAAEPDTDRSLRVRRSPVAGAPADASSSQPPFAEPARAVDAVPAVLAPRGSQPASDVLRRWNDDWNARSQHGWWIQTLERFESYDTREGGARVHVEVGEQRSSSSFRRSPPR